MVLYMMRQADRLHGYQACRCSMC